MSSSNLPPEITEAILSCLPAKTLGRFKSVSKTWESLISNPQFINQTHKTTEKLILIAAQSLYSLELPLNSKDENNIISATGKEIIFPSSPLITWRCIWGSCNGLVLGQDMSGRNLIVNPTTKEIWEVPPSPFVPSVGNKNSVMRCGFGYDSSTDDYKVVLISNCGGDVFVSVYSLRNDSWKKLLNHPYSGEDDFRGKAVLVNGNINWLTIPSLREQANGDRPTVHVFSLANEEFNKIELPGSVGNDVPLHFAVDGKLGIFASWRRAPNDLWVMEEYGVADSWTKIHINTGSHSMRPYYVAGCINRDIIVQDRKDEDIVVACNVDERRCRNVRIEGVPRGFVIGGTHFETLESPAKCFTRVH